MPLSTKIIRVPVKLVDGQWELLYGGAVKVKNGTFGELHISYDQIDDKAFLRTFTEKRRLRVLGEGAELRVALTIRSSLPSDLLGHLLARDETRHNHTANISVDSRFVRIHLASPTNVQERRGEEKGGLWLMLEGMEPRGIESGIVRLPEVQGLKVACSVNHAFTLLSEKFEPWRQAHTGSIYERVFYPEEDGLWYPLNDLRDKELASAERQVIAALWQEVTKLGTAFL
jgi:hypothetical protein